MTSIYLSSTIAAVQKCWRSAEDAARSDKGRSEPGACVRFITRDFFIRLKTEFENANRHKLIEAAFCDDLERYLQSSHRSPWVFSAAARHFATGVVARVTYHVPEDERKTGGDFGLALRQPSVSFSLPSGFSSKQHCHGLLCQAKRGALGGGWGKLTDNQKIILPARLAYLALVLYDYEDTERTRLNEFKWKSCKDASCIETIEGWLRNSTIPGCNGSELILYQLASPKYS